MNDAWQLAYARSQPPCLRWRSPAPLQLVPNGRPSEKKAERGWHEPNGLTIDHQSDADQESALH